MLCTWAAHKGRDGEGVPAVCQQGGHLQGKCFLGTPADFCKALALEVKAVSRETRCTGARLGQAPEEQPWCGSSVSCSAVAVLPAQLEASLVK